MRFDSSPPMYPAGPRDAHEQLISVPILPTIGAMTSQVAPQIVQSNRWATQHQDDYIPRDNRGDISQSQLTYSYVPSERHQQLEATTPGSSHGWPNNLRHSLHSHHQFQHNQIDHQPHQLHPHPQYEAYPSHNYAYEPQVQLQAHPVHSLQAPHQQYHPQNEQHLYSTAPAFLSDGTPANADLADLGLASRDSRLDARWSSFMADSGLLEGLEFRTC